MERLGGDLRENNVLGFVIIVVERTGCVVREEELVVVPDCG